MSNTTDHVLLPSLDRSAVSRTEPSGRRRHVPRSTEGAPLVDGKGRRSYVTSAGAGPSLGKHILMSYLPPEEATVGNELAQCAVDINAAVAGCGEDLLGDPLIGSMATLSVDGAAVALQKNLLGGSRGVGRTAMGLAQHRPDRRDLAEACIERWVVHEKVLLALNDRVRCDRGARLQRAVIRCSGTLQTCPTKPHSPAHSRRVI